jgi:hypothetical protein
MPKGIETHPSEQKTFKNDKEFFVHDFNAAQSSE